MKKSLKVIATATLAFSMFASVAMAAETTGTTTTPTATTTATAVKTSKDFKDLAGLDVATTAKIDAMLAKGFFEGTAADQFGIKENMTRAQFAKILVLVSGAAFDATVKTSSFADVKADDTANAWAIPYIEAAKKAGLIDGKSDTSFDPSANVTLGEFATALLKGLKITPSTTGTPWYADAVKQAVEKKLLPEGTDGSVAATRADLVVAAYAADAAIQSLSKASVTEAKATGVKTVTVNFNKAIDDTKATLALTKGTIAVASTAKFAADKKSAVLTLTDIKVSEGSYTVTLGGLDAAGLDKTTATFTAENEKVTKLSFVNAGDKIAKAVSVTIKVKAENQYGEIASINGGSYTAYVLGDSKTLTRNEDTGLLEVKLNTAYKGLGVGVTGTSTDPQFQSELDVLPINVFLNNSSVSVQKTYKIGTEPIVSKIELGAPKYPNVKTALTEAGDYAELTLSRFDQYGDVVEENSIAPTRTDYDAIITPYSFDSLSVLKSTSGGAYGKVKVVLDKNTEKAGDYVVTVYVGASSATATIKVESTKVANKVEFGTFTGVLAEGDGTKYLPIVAYDAAGNKLSASDIATNAKNNRFAISVSGASLPADGQLTGIGTDTFKNGNAAIVQTGEHKGKLQLTGVTATANSVVFVNVGIYSANVQNNAQQSFTVQSTRKPETIVLDGDKPAQKGIATAATTVKWFVKDQYGEKLASTIAAYHNDYKVKVTVTDSTYANYSDGTHAYNVAGDQTFDVFANAFGTGFNSKGQVLTAGSATGTTKIKAELIQVRDANHVTLATPTVLKTIDSSLAVVANSGLTYSANAVKDLYAALDSAVTPASDKNITGLDADGDPVTEWAFNSSIGRALGITALDKSGDKVALPAGRIVSASSSDVNVAKVVQNGNEVTVIGNKAGKASITVVYKTTGTSTADATLDVNVKTDAVVASTITADTTSSVTAVSLQGATNKKASEVISALKIVDNYGVEYTTTELERYRTFLGLQYVVTDVVGTGTPTVTVNGDGTLNIGATVTGFNIKAIAGGKSVTAIIN